MPPQDLYCTVTSCPSTESQPYPLPCPCRNCHAQWTCPFPTSCCWGNLALCEAAAGHARPSSWGDSHSSPNSVCSSCNTLERYCGLLKPCEKAEPTILQIAHIILMLWKASEPSTSVPKPSLPLRNAACRAAKRTEIGRSQVGGGVKTPLQCKCR